MYILQRQLTRLRELVTPGKVVILYGSRRTGKTTLLQKYLENQPPDKTLMVNGDDMVVRQHLESQSIDKLKDFIGNHELLIIDEAQYIEKVGLNLKLIVDHMPHLKIIATGSSSFELARDIGEPLTGRKWVLRLFPLAQMEISEVEKKHETQANLEARLLYGSYPEVITTRDNRFRCEYLRELVSSYLFKDILVLEGIRHSTKILRLLQLLAFQIGKEVSMTELGTQVGMSKNTVERYLDLLEKVFVLYKLNGFSRNLRKEITKNARYYFYDIGVRNAVIENFNPLALRNDIGQLWENYIMVERLKKHEYLREAARTWFWRTYNKNEIDLIEERNGALYGYEIKWKPKRLQAPREWRVNYPDSRFEIISQENYLSFIL